MTCEKLYKLMHSEWTKWLLGASLVVKITLLLVAVLGTHFH